MINMWIMWITLVIKINYRLHINHPVSYDSFHNEGSVWFFRCASWMKLKIELA